MSGDELTRSGDAERAGERVARLRAAFADAVEVIALMYRDEDWRHLTRPDGGAYRSMAELVADELGVASAMARRYVQAARDFYLPLAAVAVDGTPIAITSADVRELGTAGLADAVDRAQPALAQTIDPDVSSTIIADALAAVRAERGRDPVVAVDVPDDDVRVGGRTAVLVAAVETIAAASAGEVVGAVADRGVVERAWGVLGQVRLVG
jgi:hypothetical protein